MIAVGIMLVGDSVGDNGGAYQCHDSGISI